MVISPNVDTNTNANTYQYVVKILDPNGAPVQEQRFDSYSEAQNFMTENHRMGNDIRMTRVELLTESV